MRRLSGADVGGVQSEAWIDTALSGSLFDVTPGIACGGPTRNLLLLTATSGTPSGTCRC
jgi:hypothetical protein